MSCIKLVFPFRNPWILILFLSGTSGLLAQNAKIDSLKAILVSSQSDEDKVTVLNNLSTYYTSRYIDSSQYYVDKALQLSKKSDYQKGLGIAYRQQAVIYYYQGLLDKALVYFDSSIVVRQAIGDIIGEILVINNMALVYQALGRFEESKGMLNEALSLAIKHENKPQQASISNNIALYFNNKSLYDSAIHYYQKALSLNRAINNRADESLVLNNIGVIYFKRSLFKEAFDYYEESYHIAKNIDNPRLIKQALMNMAIVYKVIGMHDRSVSIYQELLEKAVKEKDEKFQLSLEINLASAFVNMRDYISAREMASRSVAHHESSQVEFDIAKSHFLLAKALYEMDSKALAKSNLLKGLDLLEQGNLATETIINRLLAEIYLEEGQLNQAKVLLERNIEMEESAIDLGDLAESYKSLTKVAFQVNDLESAFRYQSKALALSEDVFDQERNNALIRSAFEFETERKELALELANEKVQVANARAESINERRKKTIYSLALLSLAILFLFIWRSSIAKSKRISLEDKASKLSLVSENEQLKNEALRRELELKDKEVMSQALQLAHKNKSIQDLKEKLNLELKVRPNEGLKRTIDLLENNINSAHDWAVFRESFEKVHIGFFEKLQDEFSNLTPRDLQLCALTRLNLSIKEASNILGVSQEGIKKARYRIRKKMGLTDYPHSLTSFLMRY